MPKLLKQLGYLTKQNQNEYNIWLYGAVGWEFDSKTFINDINDLPSGVTTLNLYVNSPGGLVDEGYAILTNIQRLKQRLTVVTHTDAMAYSMGSALVAAGDKHIMSPTSRMMIHNPWMFLDIFGTHNSKELQDLIDWLANLKVQLDDNSEVLAGAYQKRLQMPVHDIMDKFFDGKDHFLTPEQCLDLGLCDEILDFEVDSNLANDLKNLDAINNTEQDFRIAAFGEDYAEEYLRDKKVFDYNLQNSEIVDGPKSQNNSKDMDLIQLAKAMGISEDRAKKMSDEDILAEARKLSNEVEDLRQKNKSLNDLNNDLKERKNGLETEVDSLKEKTFEHDAKDIVSKVIKEVEGNAEGKRVNANVVSQIEKRALDYVKVESEEEKDQVFDHMKLKAQNALIPIGEDPDLNDDEESRGKTEYQQKEEKFEKAADRGKAKREKREARLNKKNRTR